MTGSELEKILSVRFEEGCADGWGALLLEREWFEAAMDLALRRKGVVPFRAAYALERVFLKAPERFEPYCERFTADYPVAVHRSVWRHYGKIMALLLKRKTLTLNDGQAVRIAEAALERLIDDSVPVGARVWSIDILHELRGRVPWIDRELPGLIDGLTIAPSPAMISRLRRFRFMK
jgi:hypothetical protein